jgi:hypothetical protein
VEATLANYSDGTSVSTIRYTEPAVAAARMKAEYGGTLPPFTQVAGRSGVLVEGGGIALFRFQDGARLVCVTGANRTALERRLKRPLPGAPQEAGPVKPTQKSTVAAVIGGVLVYTVFVAWVFVRLSTWAASSGLWRVWSRCQPRHYGIDYSTSLARMSRSRSGRVTGPMN